MKGFVLIFLIATGCSYAAAGTSPLAMPNLNQIQQVTLPQPYSCGEGGGYKTSALFLSGYSKQQNAPDLLYNGACGSVDYIEASTAGDDFAMLSDLGNVRLEDVSAMRAINWTNVVGGDNLFKATQDVKVGHTYAVLISKSNIRALYAIKVISHVQDGPLTIQFAVKSYLVQSTVHESPGFGWEVGNGPLK